MKMESCCFPGCGKKGMVRYERLVRGANGQITQRRRRTLCGEHDNIFTTMIGKVWDLMTLKHPEA